MIIEFSFNLLEFQLNRKNVTKIGLVIYFVIFFLMKKWNFKDYTLLNKSYYSNLIYVIIKINYFVTKQLLAFFSAAKLISTTFHIVRIKL
jgi:hypothetical protein